MRRGSLALVAILVLGSLTKLFLPQTQSTPAGAESRSAGIPAKVAPGSQETSQTKATRSIDWYPTQVREKIRDFFGEERGPELDPYEYKISQKRKGGAGGAVDIDHVCESIDNWCVPQISRNKIHFVIAATPDPVHSHLGLFFDRSIDAIQQGATSQGFLFDRAIMPWQYFDLPASQMTDEDKFLQRVRESYPGLMIFRGKANADPLFIFVVGETPTAGINKAQLYNAIAMVHEIREGEDSIKSGQKFDFAVLGPSFSGSLYSLQEALQNYFGTYWKNREDNAPVIPVLAVVMATNAIKEFGEAPLPHVRAAIFWEDGAAALSALLKYAGDLGYRDSDVAVLNEDDTAYGLRGTSAEPDTHDNYSTLYFPRGISQFRSAYSKDLQNQGQAADPNQPQRRTLRLDLGVTGSDDDNVTPYATAQTALSQEAIMLSIVSELSRGHSKFILIRATDPLDELFLARYLSSQYPDARLVVPTPDLLFAREEGGVLDGALGLNTYPVSPANLNPLCVSSPGILRVFPAASSAGLFNATAALLSGLSSPGDERPSPTGKVGSLSVSMNPCTLSPNLWLTVVSRNSVYPMKVLSSKGSLFFPNSGKPGPAESDKRSGRIPPLWGMLCVLCVVLLVNHLRCIWKQETLGYWLTARHFKNPDQFSNGKAWIVMKACILWSGAVAIVGMTVIFISSISPFPGGSDRSGTFFIKLLLWILLACFTFAVTRDFFFIRRERTLACLFFFLAVCFTWAGIAYAHESTQEMVLWQQRTIALDSHVSSATPMLLLLAAFYTWFWFSLKSESLTDWRCPRLPKESDLPSESTAYRIRNVIHSFGGPWWIFWGGVLVVGLLVVQGIKTGPGHVPIRSLEGSRFDMIYCIFLGLALLLLVTTVLRIAAVWWKLEPVLIALNRPGMRQSLQRLKGFEWDVIWNPFQSMRDEAKRLYLKEIYVVERLRESLGGAGDTLDPGVIASWKADLGDILTLLRSIKGLLPTGFRAGLKDSEELMTTIKNMQEKLAETAGVLCRDQLQSSWNALPADEGTEIPPEKTQSWPETMKVKAEIREPSDSLRAVVNAEIKDEHESKATAPPRLSVKSTQLAEEFVACVYSTFITIVLLRIRWLVFSSVVIYTAVVFSSTSYPFQPAASLRTLALLLFLLGGIVVSYVYEEMHRDPTVRCMTSTDPNKVDAAFWLKLVSAGLLPLLGLLTSLFPQVGHFLYTIAAPILQATQ